MSHLPRKYHAEFGSLGQAVNYTSHHLSTVQMSPLESHPLGPEINWIVEPQLGTSPKLRVASSQYQ